MKVRVVEIVKELHGEVLGFDSLRVNEGIILD
jgi:hypothetical protein